MEAGVLNFTPEEYQILEDIEFDETIERPEAVRGYAATTENQAHAFFGDLVLKDRIFRLHDSKLLCSLGSTIDKVQTTPRNPIVNQQIFTTRAKCASILS